MSADDISEVQFAMSCRIKSSDLLGGVLICSKTTAIGGE